MTMPAKARDTIRAVTDWCDREGIACTFSKLNGGHLVAELSRSGRTRRVSFSGTPADRRRVTLNVLRDVRKEARALGWAPENERKADNG